MMVHSLDEATLKKIAETSNGFYLPGGSDMSVLADDIRSLQSGETGEQIITRPIERFGIFVALAFLALSFEILLPETRREHI